MRSQDPEERGGQQEGKVRTGPAALSGRRNRSGGDGKLKNSRTPYSYTMAMMQVWVVRID